MNSSIKLIAYVKVYATFNTFVGLDPISSIIQMVMWDGSDNVGTLVIEWRKFCRGLLPQKGQLPADIPRKPDESYKSKGWVSWGDWLGKVKN